MAHDKAFCDMRCKALSNRIEQMINGMGAHEARSAHPAIERALKLEEQLKLANERVVFLEKELELLRASLIQPSTSKI